MVRVNECSAETGPRPVLSGEATIGDNAYISRPVAQLRTTPMHCRDDCRHSRMRESFRAPFRRMQMMLHRVSRYMLALGLLALPATARAQAFGLNEIGSCAIARGFAVTSAPCADGSSIYWN